jgi:uncharacterized protein (TIGR03382 family)
MLGAHLLAKPVNVAATVGLLIATLVGVGVIGSTAGAATQVPPSPAAAATQGGCGYGRGGANDGALCWLNMSTYNPFLAQSPFGQRMSLPVGNGYTVSFSVSDQKVVSPSFGEVGAPDLNALPGAWLGEKAYRGTPGRPVLYQNVSGGTDAVKLSDISVTDAAGNPVTNYNLVVANAESTDGGQSSITSDKPLSGFDEVGDSGVCSNGLHGLGTHVVSCNRSNRREDGAFFLEAQNPQHIAATFHGEGFSGIAFGLLTSQVTLTQHVATRRNPTDAFQMGVLSSPWNVITTASTGDSATVGPINVVSFQDNSYILKERAVPASGANLSKYNITWSCTDNGSPYSLTLAPGSSGAAISVSPHVGDNIACTVTNAVPVVSGSFVSPEAGVGAGAAVAGLLGFGWLLRRRSGLPTS